MEIKRIGTQPSAKGLEDWFTGTVRIDSLFSRESPARVAGSNVTFELVYVLHGIRIHWDRL